MTEKIIHNGDVLTFTALQWEEDSFFKVTPGGRISFPTMLLTPVTHVYEDGIELETVINEALVDAQVDGKLADMNVEGFLAERGLNLKYLKHIAQTIKKAKQSTARKYRVLKETYQFYSDENGRLHSVSLGYINQLGTRQNITTYDNGFSGGFRRAGEDKYIIAPPPPTDYARMFQSEVWNVFDALGRSYTAVPFPDPTSIGHRLIAPTGTEFAKLNVMKSVIDWLVDNRLAKKGQGSPLKFGNQECPVWYVLTGTGKKVFAELAIYDDCEEKFILKFQPIRKI